MLSAIGRRLTYANVVATLALVFSMSGAAVAANHYLITSTKQISPKVLKSLKGSNGRNGAAGPAGPAGTNGAAGAPGAPGEPRSAVKFSKTLEAGGTIEHPNSTPLFSVSGVSARLICEKAPIGSEIIGLVEASGPAGSTNSTDMVAVNSKAGLRQCSRAY